MLEEFIKNKVYYKIFDKNYHQSTGTYVKNKFKDASSIEQVEKNIASVQAELGADDVVILRQIHSNIVILPAGIDFKSQPEADASVTHRPKLALAIQTADCVPVLFASKDGNVIGAAHCGWKSLKSNIILEVINKMKALSAEEIYAIIGPSIAQKSYEVDEVYYQNFIAESADYAKLFIPSVKKSHYMFDIAGMAKLKLKEAGAKLIHHIDEDTCSSSEKYPSYRRSCLTGEAYESNILSVIMIGGKE